MRQNNPQLVTIIWVSDHNSFLNSKVSSSKIYDFAANKYLDSKLINVPCRTQLTCIKENWEQNWADKIKPRLQEAFFFMKVSGINKFKTHLRICLIAGAQLGKPKQWNFLKPNFLENIICIDLKFCIYRYFADLFSPKFVPPNRQPQLLHLITMKWINI